MGSAKRRPADEPPATIDEIAAAIQVLITVELVRIRKFSYRPYLNLGRRGAGLSPEDLIQDAMMAILDGRRKWPKNRVDFVKLLLGVNQSL